METLGTIYERIIKDDSRNSLSRLLSPYRIEMFKTTAEVTGNKTFSTDLDIKIFKPNKPFRVFIILLIAGFWGFILYKATNRKVDTELAILFTLLFGALSLISILWQYFYDPSVNLNISINGTGIQVGETILEWNEIRETNILTLPKGRIFATHLVIILKNDAYRKYELDFNIKSVSKYIEFYKKYSL